jgi:hypothetical protein
MPFMRGRIFATIRRPGVVSMTQRNRITFIVHALKRLDLGVQRDEAGIERMLDFCMSENTMPSPGSLVTIERQIVKTEDDVL